MENLDLMKTVILKDQKQGTAMFGSVEQGKLSELKQAFFLNDVSPELLELFLHAPLIFKMLQCSTETLENIAENYPQGIEKQKLLEITTLCRSSLSLCLKNS